MAQTKMSVSTRRPAPNLCVFDIQGDVTGFAEDVLMAAYTEASDGGAKVIGLNFTELEYMNSSGIGLLVTLLIRVQRNKQQLMAFGLSDHYCQIFELTRLDEAIAIYADERAALAALPKG